MRTIRATLKDIANELNISTNTVSKALNDKAKVSDELREKIKETAERLGYEKNAHASRLSQKPIVIGVLINGYDENYYRYTLKGLKKAEAQLFDSKVSFDIRIVDIDCNTEKNSKKACDEFVANGVRGIIFNDCNFKSLRQIIGDLNEKNIYSALLNYDYKEADRSFSMTNNYEIAVGLALDVLKMKLNNEDTIALYPQIDKSENGKNFIKYFKKLSKEYNFKNIITVFSDDELFDTIKKRNVRGIYISHASYLNVCNYIRTIDSRKKPCLVVSDIYDAAVPFVEDGTIDAVIYQEPQKQAFDTAMAMYRAIFERNIAEDKLKITPLLILRSNYKKYL